MGESGLVAVRIPTIGGTLRKYARSRASRAFEEQRPPALGSTMYKHAAVFSVCVQAVS